MCIVFWAEDHIPRYKLVLVSNRDEFFSRQTTAVHVWPRDHDGNGTGGHAQAASVVLAGRDEAVPARGTWFGLNTSGRFCTLTNVRVPEQRAGMASRGALVANYLRAGERTHDGGSAMRYLERAVAPEYKRYNGFNLLCADFGALPEDGTGNARLCGGMHAFNNVPVQSPHGPKPGSRPLSPCAVGAGVHGVCNSTLDDDSWPKLRAAKESLRAMLAQCEPGEEIDPQRLFALAGCNRRPPRNQLPSTGVTLAWERVLSSIFVHGPRFGYGTVSSAVLMVEHSGRVTFVERTFDQTSGDPAVHSERHFELMLPGCGAGMRAGAGAERVPRLVRDSGSRHVPGVDAASKLTARARRALKRGAAAAACSDAREPERQPFEKQKRGKLK